MKVELKDKNGKKLGKRKKILLLPLESEIKKKKKYIYIYIYTHIYKRLQILYVIINLIH